MYLGLIYFLIQACVYGVVYYLPPQVGRLLGRHVGFVVGLVTAIPWACALLASYYVPRFAEAKRPIRFGVLKGKVRVSGDFDAPLPTEVIASFEGRK